MTVLLSAGEREDFVKMVLYGPSGTGKTTCGVTAPDPVILLSERQGYRSVVDAAKRLNKPIPPTFWMQSPQMLRDAFVALRAPKDPLVKMVKLLGGTKEEAGSLPYTMPRTVVLDSITEFFRLVGDEIDEQSPPKDGRDGLPIKAERYWQVLGDRCIGFIRGARDLPFNVLFLALLDDREIGEGEEKSRVYGPAVPMRKLPAQLASAVNAVGVTHVKRMAAKGEDGAVTSKLDWRVRFAGPSWMLTKPLRPLKDIEEPDFTQWVDTLGGE